MKGRVSGAGAVHRWFALAEEVLGQHCDRLNRLNVFPVPDSDTGTNMLASVRACRQALDGVRSEDIGELLAHAGSQAMYEARGNSGTLLAVLVSGFAERLHGHRRLTVENLSEAMERGSLRAWSALSTPVPGTMLSIVDTARECLSRHAGQAHEPQSRAALVTCFEDLVSQCHQALVETEFQLPALRRAGVVDSGGSGLFLVLLALRATVMGHDDVNTSLLHELSGWEEDTRGSAPGEPRSADEDDPGIGHSGVEVMATVRLDPLGGASLRHRLDEIGEAVIITPIDAQPDGAGFYRWRIHVHTADEPQVADVVHEAGEVQNYSASPLYWAQAE